MRAEALDSYSTKFDEPFTAWLYDHQAWDEESGESDAPTGWFARCGRSIIVEDSRGFVGRTRYESADLARQAFDALSAEFGEWACDEDDES